MKVIAVSHGSYSKGLVESTQMLVGEQENLVAYGLFPEQTVATLTEKLEAEIQNTKEGEEILFVSDRSEMPVPVFPAADRYLQRSFRMPAAQEYQR